MGWQPGDVDGQNAQVKQSGQRVEAIYDFNGPNHAHIVSNDGVNADYLRNSDGTVVVDSSSDTPYDSK